MFTQLAKIASLDHHFMTM